MSKFKEEMSKFDITFTTLYVDEWTMDELEIESQS